MDEFNKVYYIYTYLKLSFLNRHPYLYQEFDAYLWRKLGEDIAALTAEYGSNTRVDASGVLLLRSLCKLTHKGHMQYAKGDGHAFHDFLEKEWHKVKTKFAKRVGNFTICLILL
jgi:hypothetical protein